MFEFLVVALFALLSVCCIRLICKTARRLVSAVAAALLLVALPLLISYLSVAGGIMLLMPLGLSSIALCILNV